MSNQDQTDPFESIGQEFNNLPNQLTMARLMLVPVVILLLTGQSDKWEFLEPLKGKLGWTAAWIFVIASITDFIDGHIARRRNLVTTIGSFLDPVADKFLVVSSLILLQELGRIPVLLVIVLVLREIYITALRLLAAQKDLKVPVDQWGKVKTALQMMAIPMLMVNEDWNGIPFGTLGTILISCAAFFSLYSAIGYTYRFFKRRSL